MSEVSSPGSSTSPWAVRCWRGLGGTGCRYLTRRITACQVGDRLGQVRSVGGLCGWPGLPLCVARSRGKTFRQGSDVAGAESEGPAGCHLLTHWRDWRLELGQWGWRVRDRLESARGGGPPTLELLWMWEVRARGAAKVKTQVSQ